MKLLIALCYIVVAGLIPVYLRLVPNGHTAKTMLLKMTNSAMFVAVCLLAGFMSGNTGTGFFRYMLIGFCCSWVGDVLLHGKANMIKYVIGGCAFLGAHVFFIIAYLSTARVFTPDAPVLTVKEAVITAALWLFVVIITVILKIRFKKLTVPVFVYVLALMFMLVKASGLGFMIMQSGGSPVAFALLTVGAALFAVSDITLGINFFSKPSRFKEALNIIAYYAGQLLLALAVAFVS